MKLLDIDKVFEARINLGIPEDTEHFLHLLSLCWEKYGEPTTMQNPEELKNEVARLNSALRDIDRDNARLHNQYTELEKQFNYLICRIIERINTEG